MQYLVVFIGLFIGFTSCQPQQWKQLTFQNSPAPNFRMDHAADVIFNDTLVIFGGWSGSGLFLNDTWSIDVSSTHLVWQNSTPVNWLTDNRRADHVIGITDPDKSPTIYCFAGGSYPSDTLYNNIVAYNMSSGIWTNITIPSPSPAARMGHSSVFIKNNELLVFAGDTNFGTVNDLWVIQINPVVKAIQIETTGSKPKARLWHTATLVANDTMYVFGGKSSESGGVFNDLWQFNLTSMTWAEIIPQGNNIPAARSGHVATFYNGNFYIFSGQGRFGWQIMNDLWMFNIKNKTWTQLQLPGPTPSARVGSKGHIVSGNNFILYSGCTNDTNGCQSFVNDLWSLVLH